MIKIVLYVFNNYPSLLSEAEGNYQVRKYFKSIFDLQLMRPLKKQTRTIEVLDMYCFTYDGDHKDFPRDVETVLLKKYYQVFDGLPGWNKEF